MKLPEMRRRDEVRGEQSQEFVVDPKPDKAGHLLPILPLGGVGFVPHLNHLEQSLRHEGRSNPLPRRGVHLCPDREHLKGGAPGPGVEGLLDRSSCRCQPDPIVIGKRSGPFYQGVDHLLSLVSVDHSKFAHAP